MKIIGKEFEATFVMFEGEWEEIHKKVKTHN
jgi:hypothetical protein